MKKLSLFSLLILVLVLGCSDDSTSPNNNTKELMPLKIGNSWVHNITFYESPTIEHSGKVTSTVVSEEMYNGEKYYRIEMSDGDPKEILSSSYHINKSDGHYMLSFDDNNEPETDILIYPVSEGEIIHNDEFQKFYVEKVDTLISTSAGKFKCIMYVLIVLLDGEEKFKRISYYCPGVGQIAVENMWRDDETGTQYIYLKSELVSYSLK